MYPCICPFDIVSGGMPPRGVPVVWDTGVRGERRKNRRGMASAAVSMNWAGTSQAINPGTLSMTGWGAAKTTALGRKPPMRGACGG